MDILLQNKNMKKYKCLHDYPLPKGTILTLEQMDVGYEDLTPYWAYSFRAVINERLQFGELSRREVEESPELYELIEPTYNF